ncbi:hypothetical protein AMECASPLE_027930 [Ameca splendens]|uniref:Uncharacterized protein n=1 Tax=Ameca splendens TaxID=208324 RepID=A0ABV0Z437_9TELE
MRNAAAAVFNNCRCSYLQLDSLRLFFHRMYPLRYVVRYVRRRAEGGMRGMSSSQISVSFCHWHKVCGEEGWLNAVFVPHPIFTVSMIKLYLNSHAFHEVECDHYSFLCCIATRKAAMCVFQV